MDVGEDDCWLFLRRQEVFAEYVIEWPLLAAFEMHRVEPVEDFLQDPPHSASLNQHSALLQVHPHVLTLLQNCNYFAERRPHLLAFIRPFFHYLVEDVGNEIRLQFLLFCLDLG